METQWDEVLVGVVESDSLQKLVDHCRNVLEDRVLVIVFEGREELVLPLGVATLE